MDKTGTVTEGKMTVAEWDRAHTDFDFDEADGDALSHAHVNAVRHDGSLTMKVSDDLTHADAVALVAATETRSEHAFGERRCGLRQEHTPQSPGAHERRHFCRLEVEVHDLHRQCPVRVLVDVHLPSSLSTFDSVEETQGRTAIFVYILLSPLCLPSCCLCHRSVRRAEGVICSGHQSFGGNGCRGQYDDRRCERHRHCYCETGRHQFGPCVGQHEPQSKAAVVTELMEEHGRGIAMVSVLTFTRFGSVLSTLR